MLAGVDIGGTFTDLVLSENGQLTIYKLPSTPRNPARAMLAGLEIITDGRLDQLGHVAHGSTVATNAILERKGARTAFITTQGFRDILFIGRQNRPVLYALQPQLPPYLIPRDYCYEIPERLEYTGRVLQPLDVTVLDSVLDSIATQNVGSIAICLLYSYINPVHEVAIRDRIVQRGLLEAWQVALSSDVLPEFREYERASTVALEAYVRPVMGQYIGQLEAELPSSVGLRVMKSDGGVIGAGRVRQQAVQTALSGPAAGVIGAYHIAQMAGFERVITLDMGGTSTDVAVCPGEVLRRPQSDIDGLPLRVRLLDIETIGAGGGSIARVDAGGALRVGPESAGADPGPAVYGLGGELPTVSDANAALGRLDRDHFLAGNMSLDMDAAFGALQPLAGALGLTIEKAARGIVDVANANIDRALRRVTVARGYDPRDFTLVAFGGAGALHACDVADRLQIPRVLVPRYPGVLCAFGLLVADVVLDYTQAILAPVKRGTVHELSPLLTGLMAQADHDLAAEGINRRDRYYLPSVDVRYQGQAYELNIPFQEGMGLEAAFHDAHQNTYGHALHDRQIEVVSLRLQAVGKVEHPVMEPETVENALSVDAARVGEKSMLNGDTLIMYERERLEPDMLIDGPGLVLQMDSTVYVPVSWYARVDGYRNLILERDL